MKKKRMAKASLRVSDERPVIRVLMVLPSMADPSKPRMTAVVDLVDVPKRLNAGFKVVAMDPADHDAFIEWRKRHPEATSDAG